MRDRQTRSTACPLWISRSQGLPDRDRRRRSYSKHLLQYLAARAKPNTIETLSTTGCDCVRPGLRCHLAQGGIAHAVPVHLPLRVGRLGSKVRSSEVLFKAVRRVLQCLHAEHLLRRTRSRADCPIQPELICGADRLHPCRKATPRCHCRRLRAAARPKRLPAMHARCRLAAV